MMHNPGATEQLLFTVMNLASELSQLGQNPGLPEMVRGAFTEMSNNLHSSRSLITGRLNDDILNGISPRCQALHDARKWLGIPEVDLSLLGVPKLWSWRQPPSEEHGIEYYNRYWSQFFYKAYPSSAFKGNGRLVTQFTEGGVDYTITAETKPLNDQDGPDPEVMIEEVSVSFQPKQQFWVATVTIRKSAIMFNPSYNPTLMVTHMVELASAETYIRNPIEFINDYAIGPIADILGFVFEDYPLSTSLGTTINVEDEINKVAEGYPEHCQIAAKNAMVYACNTHRSDELQITVPGVGIVTLSAGNGNWRSWERCVEDRKERTWYKDTPVVKVDRILRHGYNIRGVCLPLDWVKAIDAAIIAALVQVCHDVKQWPLSPEELAAKAAANAPT